MIEILAWNDDYGMLPDRFDGDGIDGDGVDCPEVRVVRDRARLAEVDAVIFHIPSLREPLERFPKRPGQRWVAWSMESDANYPLLTFPPFLRNFDLTMTYRRDADVWVPYLTSELLDPGDVPVPPRDAGRASAVYIASNPASLSGRDAYVAELMRHLPVDSYGQCLKNRSWPTDDEGRATKLAVLAQYPFTLAFENSVTDDYVTEKFFDPFVAGSVPVYLGAPNVADFAPGDDCFVDVSAFAGPRELAAHLLGLLADDAAYRALHAWRSEGARPQYRAMIDELSPHPLGRLAALLTPE